MNTHKCDLIEIAEKFQSLKPKETNFDNTKTFKYFHNGDDSTLKDYLCSNNHTIKSKRSHHKSLSKNSLNLFNTTSCTTLQSTKKISFKVPSKYIDDEVEYEINLDNDKSVNYQDDNNEFFRFTDAIEINFDEYDNTIILYHCLYSLLVFQKIICKILNIYDSISYFDMILNS